MNRCVPKEVIPLKVARSRSLDLSPSEDESVVFFIIISSSPFPTFVAQLFCTVVASQDGITLGRHTA